MSVRRDHSHRRDPNLFCPNTSTRLDLVLRAGQAHRQLVSTGGAEEPNTPKVLEDLKDKNVHPAIPWSSRIGQPNQIRVPVKLKGPTIGASEWGDDVKFPEDMREPLEKIYNTLKGAFPKASFDFFTDGDPPNKLDPWKLMVADFAQRDDNTLTILRVYDKKKTYDVNASDVQSRRGDWVEKLVSVDRRLKKYMDKRVYVQFLAVNDSDKEMLNKQDTSAQRKFSAMNTAASITYKFKPESIVFDVNKTPNLTDQEGYRDFEVQNEEGVGWMWVAYHQDKTTNRRQITKINGASEKSNLEKTRRFSRSEMENFLKEKGVNNLTVESQISKEIRQDTPNYDIQKDQSGDSFGFADDDGNDYLLAVKDKNPILRIIFAM